MIVGYARTFGYFANAVTFDGANDYLTRGGDLTGNADGKVGIFSCWMKANGGDGTIRSIAGGAGGVPEFRHHSDNKFHLDLYTSGLSNILRMTSSAFLAGSGWKHLLASWDLAAGATHLYVNDVSDKALVTGPTNNTINYTRTDHLVGARDGGSNKINADLADLYINHAAYLDLSVEANRRKFISATGKPVYLGASGQGPTGSSPLVFLSGPTASWETNRGTGGGFTESGALTDATTSPSQ